MEQGFGYFDTAYPYHEGLSETVFQEAVAKRYPRNAYTITDKLPLYLLRKEEEMEQIFQQQLNRLGLDFIDYYWLHNVGTASYAVAQRLGAFEFVRKKERAREGRTYRIFFPRPGRPAGPGADGASRDGVCSVTTELSGLGGYQCPGTPLL